MRNYPMFVDLHNRTCLVVGAGRVGARKVATLAEFGAGEIRLVDTRPLDEEAAKLCALPGVRHIPRGFEAADLDGVFLAFACTSNAEVNKTIARLCLERGILCNVADSPADCTFTVPATVTQGDLTLAISTGGHSPALSRRIRQDLETYFGERYARFLALMGRLRPLVLAQGVATEENTRVFRGLVGSRLIEALEHGDAPLAREELVTHLPPTLHDKITELLDGLV